MKWRRIGKWRGEFMLAGAIFVSVLVLVVSEAGHLRLGAGYDRAIVSTNVSARLNELLGAVTDAEAAQRGYLLTLKDDYLAPYNQALPRVDAILEELRGYYYREQDEAGLRKLDELTTLAGRKVSEMELTISLARDGQYQSAHQVTQTEIGRRDMDQLRAAVADLQAYERDHAIGMINGWRGDLAVSRISIDFVTLFNVILLVALFRWLGNDWRREDAEQRALRERQAELASLVRDRTVELETLASHLQSVSENEKSRLARELHDELGAILTASRMDISWVKQRLGAENPTLVQKLERALTHIDQGIHAKRRIIEGLRPTTLTTLGFVTAAHDLVRETAAQAGWRLDLDLPETDPHFPDDLAIALFRILQEALTNAAKYARATEVRISLECEEGMVRLEIQDNGAGFEPGETQLKTHGLLGMRQRVTGQGGRLEVSSRPGGGTLIRALLVYNPEPPADPQ